MDKQKVKIADLYGQPLPDGVSYDQLVDSYGRTAQEFLDEHFEYAYCECCGRDKEDHTAVPFMGNWFARCDKPELTEAQIEERSMTGVVPS